MGMSYRRAWLLVAEMNRCFAERLVATITGRQGGARLTEAGAAMLAAYREQQAEAARLADHPAFGRLSGALREPDDAKCIPPDIVSE